MANIFNIAKILKLDDFESRLISLSEKDQQACLNCLNLGLRQLTLYVNLGQPDFIDFKESGLSIFKTGLSMLYSQRELDKVGERFMGV